MSTLIRLSGQERHAVLEALDNVISNLSSFRENREEELIDTLSDVVDRIRTNFKEGDQSMKRKSDPFVPRLELPEGYSREQIEALFSGALDEPIKMDWCGTFSIYEEDGKKLLTYEDVTPSGSVVWFKGKWTDDDIWVEEYRDAD